MTDLRFTGSWQFWVGVAVALVLAAAVAAFYWRETREQAGFKRWLLPLLRGLAVLLLVLIFTGPVLHHTRVIGEVAHVLLFVDSSQSMGLNDASLEPHRKLLIEEQLGQLAAGTYDPELKRALDALNQAPVQLPPGRNRALADIAPMTTNLLRAVEAAAAHLGRVRSDTWPAASQQLARFRGELVVRATELVGGTSARSRNRAGEFTALASVVLRWQREFQNAYDDYLRRLAGTGDESVKRALAAFDAQTRWQRAAALLLQSNLVAELARKHHVEIRAVSGADSETLWRGGLHAGEANREIPAMLGGSPTNRSTDLSASLLKGVEAATGADHVAAVIFSDGQHNNGRSPLETARMLGNRSVPVHTVGLGTHLPPDDLAVVAVNGPDSVFVEDRLKGEIVLKDDLPAGQGFLLKIEAAGKTLWAKTLPTEQRHRRLVPFDIPVKELAQAVSGGDTNTAALPVTLQVSARPLTDERQTNNNTASFRFQAIRQRPKVLVLDGRPRWEYRYLRNLLERDSQWEINALLSDLSASPRPWTRGTRPGTFPADRETLFSYQLVVFGDVAASQFKPEEIGWLKEFVELRGGGVIFIDGRQETLASHANSPVAGLLPVNWQGGPLEGAGIDLNLTARGRSTTALSLAPGNTESEAVWDQLPAPRWVAPAAALPGTDTLLTAEFGGRAVPALVFRRQGAGRVLYFGFDESWRWRHEHADRYHQRFWNQIARWIMDAPYPASDKFVSLDSGGLTYRPGEMAEIRAQVRDAQGRLLTRAKVEAQLFRDGRKAATVTLTSEDGEGGVYRGRSAPLTDGNYEVYVRVEGLPESEMRVKTTFVVEPREASELVELTCNERLLQQMAQASAGEYFREEDAFRVLEKLAPLSRGRIVESETILWQSWWWLGAVVALFAIEWFIRKRSGML